MAEQEIFWLTIYKALRLPVMGIALIIITAYLYNRKRREKMEEPKYRIFEED